MGDPLELAREAYAGCRWQEAHERFSAVHEDVGLAADDLAALADAAWWLGRTDESLALSEEVYRRHLHGEHVPAAARLAIEIGFLWQLRGEPTVGSGWISRATRLLADAPECPEHGYLAYLAVEEALARGDHDAAVALTGEIQAIADRHDDPTLSAVGLVLEGTAIVRRGEVAAGLAVIDEAMLPVRAGAVTPSWAGNLYCHVMSLCFELVDIRRARDWTQATERWCDQHSNPAMFTGICRVHRAQLLHLDGAWDEAEDHAARACRDLADMNVGVVAEGHYTIAELRRLRGDHEAARAAYRRARDLGRDPQPGLALLEAAGGALDGAATALATALAVTDQPLARAPLLSAGVEVATARGRPEEATAAAEDLAATARRFATPGLRAAADHALGVARLASGDAEGALGLLQAARRAWWELDARYEGARSRLWAARALQALGDHGAAEHERGAAAAVFADLGAVVDPLVVDAPVGPAAGGDEPPGGLSARELEVLALVAVGRTNRQIATELTISEKTVARHLSNIFVKLGVGSRTEAAAFAFEHGLTATTLR